MNPYDIDTSKLKVSKKITDEKELLKLKLSAAFMNATSKMSTEEILSKVSIDKSDLSRIRTTDVKRFSVDRLIGLLAQLGYSTNIDVVLKKKK